MATVQDGVTKLELIKDLPSRSSISATDLYLLQTNIQSFKLTHEDLVSNLVDNTTIETNNAKLRVKNGGINLQKLANINNNSVIGNISGNSNTPTQVSIQTNLSSASAIHNTLASARSIKDYIDNTSLMNNYNGEESFTFPNGLIIKMGRLPRGSSNSTMITFNTPFPTNIITAIVTGEATDNNNISSDVNIGNTRTTSQINVRHGSGPTHINWFAIGY